MKHQLENPLTFGKYMDNKIVVFFFSGHVVLCGRRLYAPLTPQGRDICLFVI